MLLRSVVTIMGHCCNFSETCWNILSWFLKVTLGIIGRCCELLFGRFGHFGALLSVVVSHFAAIFARSWMSKQHPQTSQKETTIEPSWGAISRRWRGREGDDVYHESWSCLPHNQHDALVKHLPFWPVWNIANQVSNTRQRWNSLWVIVVRLDGNEPFTDLQVHPSVSMGSHPSTLGLLGRNPCRCDTTTSIAILLDRAGCLSILMSMLQHSLHNMVCLGRTHEHKSWLLYEIQLHQLEVLPAWHDIFFHHDRKRPGSTPGLRKKHWKWWFWGLKVQFWKVHFQLVFSRKVGTALTWCLWPCREGEMRWPTLWQPEAILTDSQYFIVCCGKLSATTPRKQTRGLSIASLVHSPLPYWTHSEELRKPSHRFWRSTKDLWGNFWHLTCETKAFLLNQFEADFSQFWAIPSRF